MSLKLNLQNKENDYFEIFGSPGREGDCFLWKGYKNRELGNTGNFFHKIFELFEYLLMKIIPRIALPIV